MTDKYNRTQIKENILKILGNNFEYYNSWKEMPNYYDVPVDLLPEDTCRRILFKNKDALKKRELDTLVNLIKQHYPIYEVTHTRIGGKGIFIFVDTTNIYDIEQEITHLEKIIEKKKRNILFLIDHPTGNIHE